MKNNTLYNFGLSLVHPFYNEPKRFEVQFENWKNWSDEAKSVVQIIVVDDCSNPPVSSYLRPSQQKRIDFNLKCYRVKQDLKYNTPGALNLGIHCSTTNWILIMDSDCLFESSMIDKVLSLEVDPTCVYFFPRKRVTTDENQKKNTRFLPCTLLFHKNVYDIIGGFDEDFTGERSGGYGFFDNDFTNRIPEFGFQRKILEDIIVTEYMESIVGPNIQQKTGVKGKILALNRILWYKKLRGEFPRNRDHLRFEWEESFKYERW